MTAPIQGTPEFDALVAETGGAALLPGFNYEAHIEATKSASSEDSSTQVAQTPDPSRPFFGENYWEEPQDKDLMEEGIQKGLEERPFFDKDHWQKPEDKELMEEGIQKGLEDKILEIPNDSIFDPLMPARGTEEFNRLAIETGGGSLLPGFNYQAHLEAVQGNSEVNQLVEKDYDFVPTPFMPAKGTDEWLLLSEETGGGSELQGFNYEAHVYATRGAEAVKLLLKKDDSFIGKETDETFYGYGGNDYIDGGAGTDTAGFKGNIAEYRFSFDSNDGGKLVIEDLVEDRDGSDKLNDIELIRMAEKTYSSEELRQIAVKQVGSKVVPEVKRLFNEISGKHLFSSNQTEVDYLTGGELGWINEGDAYKNSANGNQSVYRFLVDGSHFYTANEFEKDLLISSPEYSNFIFEGEAHSAYSLDYGQKDGLLAVKRFYNQSTGSHVYSSSQEEQEILGLNPLFVDEGIAWYSEPIV